MAKTRTDITYHLPLARADPLSIHPKTISLYAFKKRYSDYLAKYPFSEGYIGLKNPFTDHVIKSKADYNLFLREYAYYSFCREFEDRALESEELTSRIREQEQQILESYDNQYKEFEVTLQKKYTEQVAAAKEARLDATAARNSMKQAEERLEAYQKRRSIAAAVFAIVLLICSVLAFLLGQSRGEKAGFSAGRNEGYEAGRTDGYKDGYDDGVDDGYNTGFNFSQRSAPSTSGTRSWGSGSSGATRDDPVEDAYIGNKNSKKFHLPSCSYLPNQSNQIVFDSREEAIAAGYDPCGHCHP